MTQAFVYKWIHQPTGMWYIGSRTAKGCHTDDGYICSSTIVKPMIEEKPHEWKRTILETGTPQDMRKLERDLLMGCNAKHDPRSFNRHNNDGMPYRKSGTKTKRRLMYPHLMPDELSKLNETQLAELFVQERHRIEQDRDARMLMLYQFIVPKVIYKGKIPCP
jgi:hypothetical protein